MRKKNITFSDIAAETGFSKTTISRFFNNPDSLAEDTSQKIEEAMDKLGYKENKVAKILASGKTEFIGIIMPKLLNSYYTTVLNNLLDTYTKYGYKFIVFNGGDNPEIEQQYVAELMAYKVEGLIILSHTISSEYFSKYDIPVVCLEREADFAMSVETNNYAGGILATEKLIENGCDEIYHINNPTLLNIPAYGRISGFRDCCNKHDKNPQVYINNYTDDYIYASKALTETFNIIESNRGSKKIGLFMGNDVLANYMVKIILRSGKKIPQDYEIIGFDDSLASSIAFYGITTIRQDIQLIVEAIMSMMKEAIEMNSLPVAKRRPLHVGNDSYYSEINAAGKKHVIIEPTMIIRETTSN